MSPLKKVIFLSLTLFLFSFGFHKYYISLTQINYVSEQKAVQITIRTFINDIELSLSKQNNTKISLNTKKEPQDIDLYLLEYLKKNILFKINGEKRDYTFIGKKYDHDVVRFYLEITNVSEISSIEITNRLLIDHFKEQQNIIKTNINNTNKGDILNLEKNKLLLIY